jgi:hypothetical protein
MLIRTDEKSVTLTPFGSLALGAANASRGGGQSWIEIIRTALSQAIHSHSENRPPQEPSRLAAAALRPLIQCGKPQFSSASRVADRWHDW